MKIIRKIIKVVAWILVSILLLPIIILIAIQTSFVKKHIVYFAEKQANNLLNAKLSVGKLSGNFLTSIQLDDILLKSHENDTLVYVATVNFKYKLRPFLKGEIIIEEIGIEKPYVYLAQLSDSTWNVQHIMKPSENVEPDTTSSTFNMLVKLDKLILEDGTIRIKAFNAQIPAIIQNLYLDIAGSYSTNEQEINLKELSLIGLQPDFTLKKLSLHAKADTSGIKLDKLLVQTKENQLTAKAEYCFIQQNKSSVKLETTPIRLNEFSAFLPKNISLQASPIINMETTLENDHLSTNLNIKDDKGHGVDLKLVADHLLKYLTDSTTMVNYNLGLNFNKVNLGYWLNNANMQYAIDGILTAQGEGLAPETMKSTIQGSFGNIVLYGNFIPKLSLMFNYNSGDINGSINGAGKFGSILINPKIKNILGERPTYGMDLKAQNINLATITGKKEQETDINISIFIKGSGISSKTMNAKGQIEMSPSTVMGNKIDTLTTDVDFIRENIIINTFFTQALSAQLNVKGNYSLKDSSDLNLNLKIDSIQQIANIAKIDSLETNLVLLAHLSGKANDLTANINFTIGHTQYKKDISLDSLVGKLNVSILELGKHVTANASFVTNNIIASGINIDSVAIQAETDLKKTCFNLDISSTDINSHIQSTIDMGDSIDISLSDLWLNYKGYDWCMAKDTAFINIAKNQYTIHNFQLMSPSLDGVQSFSLDGTISKVSDQNLKADISNLNIGQITDLFSPNQKVNGLLNMSFDLQGSAQSPVLKGEMNVKDTKFDNYYINTFTGNVSLLDDIFKANVNIIPRDSGNVSLSGQLPMAIRLDSMTFNATPDKSDSIAAQLLIQKLPLSILKVFLPAVDEIEGLIESKVAINGTFDKANITGDFNVTDGRLKTNLYGVNYRDIQTKINISNNEISIDTFYIRSNDGTMKAGGNATFASELYKGKLNSSKLNIVFNRFNPFDHKQYNMELSGNIGLDANTDSLYFSGGLTIPEMQIYLPAVLNLMGQKSTSDEPMPLLVMELKKDSIKAVAQTDSVVYNIRFDSTATANDEMLDFTKNLRGSLRVVIPRNTWIRNENMRLELSGDVEVRKRHSFFELFGTINVVRGQYTMLGKIFVIQTGIITFQGGEELNPMLNVKAIYSFRDQDRIKHDLGISVTGSMTSPEIKFTLDDDDISEADALSYILFGVGINSLTAGQQGNLNSGINATGITGTLAASLISSQLTKLLGNTLNVDYIEFRTDGSFSNASFVIGKYITNKLFVSYEQTIGHIEDDDTPSYQVTTEYELFKFLFLQLTSSPITNGIDVIFKVNSKTKNK